MALAALAALAGDLEVARQLFDGASDHGATSALVCASTCDSDPASRAEGLRRLRDLVDDTDALNFLGIAAHCAGDRDEATSCWVRSSKKRDAVAPLLPRLTEEPRKPPAN